VHFSVTKSRIIASSLTTPKLLKFINNSSSSNKGNHDRDSVWISYLISINFDYFISPFSSLSFDLEDKSNTQDRVWPHFQTPRSSSKILRCASYSTLFPVLGNVIKHGLSCLIYYSTSTVVNERLILSTTYRCVSNETKYLVKPTKDVLTST